jgi:hypothetical protein
MPLPALLGPAAYPAAAAAAKSAMILGAEVLPTVSSASLAAVLLRIAWNRLPEWIKEDVSFRRNPEKEEEGLVSMIEKFQGLLQTGSEKLSDPVENLYAAILAYIQLTAQLKQTDPATRDAFFDSSGIPHEFCVEELLALREALDFATWAYYVDDEEFLQTQCLDTAGFDLELVQAHVARRPGSVGHYVAVSHTNKLIVIGVKGTSSLEDIFTDICGQSVDYNLGGDEPADRVEVRAKINDEVLTLLDTTCVEVVSGHERISVMQGYDEELDVRCHEGVLISAKRLYDHVLPIVEEKVIHKHYRLVLAGHSLGAGAAILLGVLLRSRFTSLENLQVYAFAPPPIVDHDISLAVSPYVTSVVHNSDLIPRWSLANLQVFLEFLRVVSEKLDEQGLRPTGPRTTAAFLRKLSMGTSGDLLMTAEQVKEAMEAAHDKVELRHPDHLYVPGKVLLMFEHWQDEPALDLNGENDKSTTFGDLKHYCSSGDGTMNVLRFIEVDGYRMLSDHITAAYYASIDSLLSTCISDETTESCSSSAT